MRVADIMQSTVITIAPGESVPGAARLARERRIRHLPVVEDGRLVGIVSDRDLKLAAPSPATTLEAHELTYLLDRLTVREIMSAGVITLPPTATIEEAARLMFAEKIGAVAVTDAGRLVGIVTETDILRLVAEGQVATAAL